MPSTTTAKATLLGLCLGAVACDMVDLPDGIVCEDAAEAVAQQLLVCTGDTDQANQRYGDFNSRYSCPGPVTDSAFTCAAAIRRAPCSVMAESSFERLVRRAAPVCNQLLTLNPDSGDRTLPPGEASASGLFNGVVTNFSCTFGPSTLTSPGTPGSLNGVVGGTQCIGDNLTFFLALSDLSTTGTYTTTAGSVPQLDSLQFPQFTGSAAGTVQAYSLNITNALLDADGYLRVQAEFHVAQNGVQLQYDLTGSLDVVLQPP